MYFRVLCTHLYFDRYMILLSGIAELHLRIARRATKHLRSLIDLLYQR